MKANDQVQYWTVMAIQTIGAVILVVRALPIYQTLLENPHDFVPNAENVTYGILCVLLIQIPHWYKSRKLLTPNTIQSNFLNRSIGFLGRILLIVLGALLTVIFFVNLENRVFSIPRIILIICILFSIFCYTKDLEELAESYKRKKRRDI